MQDGLAVQHLETEVVFYWNDFEVLMTTLLECILQGQVTSLILQHVLRISTLKL